MKNWLKKVSTALGEETMSFHPKVQVMNAVAKFLPEGKGHALRADLMRQAGFSVGAGTEVHGPPRITGGPGLESRLVIGAKCLLEPDCTFDLEEHITLGDEVTLGHQVVILTSTHELGPPKHRAGPVQRSPVVIEAGAWVGPRAIILPGVTIGAGAIVEPGSLVNKSVEPNTRVGGTPARQLEVLSAT